MLRKVSSVPASLDSLVGAHNMAPFRATQMVTGSVDRFWALPSKIGKRSRRYNHHRPTAILDLLSQFSSGIGEVATDLEDEVVIESGLHASGLAAVSCYAKYGNLFNHDAPPLNIDWLDDDESVSLGKSMSGRSVSDEMQNLAVCLATPYHPEDECPGRKVREKLEELASHRRQEENRDFREEDVDQIEDVEEAIEGAARGNKTAFSRRYRRRRQYEQYYQQENTVAEESTDDDQISLCQDEDCAGMV